MSTPAPQSEVESEYCYRHPDRQSFIHCQRCGRTICPQCQTQAAVGVQCPECVREGRAAAGGTRIAGTGTAGMPRILQQLIPRGSAPVVTYALIGLCVLVYLLQWLTGQALTGAWVLDPARIRIEPWRVLTSAFLHSPSTILHLLFNMYALFIFGPTLERFLGRVRYLALYLVGAIGGSVGVVLVYQLAVATNGASVHWLGGLLQPATALGASGAIFALMGALLVLHRAIGIAPVQLVVVVAINLAFSFFVSGIAWEAHLGGLGAGALVGAVYLSTRRQDARRRQVLLVAAVAVGLLVIAAACVIATPGAYA